MCNVDNAFCKIITILSHNTPLAAHRNTNISRAEVWKRSKGSSPWVQLFKDKKKWWWVWSQTYPQRIVPQTKLITQYAYGRVCDNLSIVIVYMRICKNISSRTSRSRGRGWGEYPWCTCIIPMRAIFVL